MNEDDGDEVSRIVRDAFSEAKVRIASCNVRRFPGETIIVVEVNAENFDNALRVASNLDSQLLDGFVTIKRITEEAKDLTLGRVTSLSDARVNDLIEILNSHSRTSEQQPSLSYIPDTAQRLNVAASRRHHLIFGRRGVGKTALMLEAKKLVEQRGASTFWMNVQTMRGLSAYGAFVTTAMRLCDIPETVHGARAKSPASVKRGIELRELLKKQLRIGQIRKPKIDQLIPEIQQLFQIFGQETQADFYLFLDDFHYLGMTEQPILLDLIHAITRDNKMWIKAAGIRHQCRWFSDNPPTGLQTGQDAAIIDLDVTLEQPAKAKEFLSRILRTYSQAAKIENIFDVITRESLDRLVLASGGVPRDFLVLAAKATETARQRSNARAVGVQDVNDAAGNIAQTKVGELEDDAASSIGSAQARIDALNCLRRFLTETRQVTYFRVDFRDKEARPAEYELMQSLMDLRLIHLINGRLSDERQAGHRSEVYMLDLSQFSRLRVRRNLRVLDFVRDHLILKDTGGSAPPRAGDTPRRLLTILRRGPVFDLSELTPFTPKQRPRFAQRGHVRRTAGGVR